ncbi:hypothetical protein HY256_08245 [Candidatus Sumerlaeota bacterium]|nr:hypothetical protein [Candidatus Sumerlaeota bacterium]
MSQFLAYLLVFIALIVVGVFAYAALYASKTIYQLLGENKSLKQAITNLTEETQIGYAKVLSQEEKNGKLVTKLVFVETDRADPLKRILEKEYEIQGDVIFFDALIVKFGNQVVMDGKEKSLYLWRRVYGENSPPSEGFPIEQEGSEPARYADIFSKLSMKNREMFWNEIWQLSNDPDRLKAAGVTAIYGNVVYKKLRPKLIYSFKIDNRGNLHPETVPAL